MIKDKMNFWLWQENYGKVAGMEISEIMKWNVYIFTGIRKDILKTEVFFITIHIFKTWKGKPGSYRSINLATSIWENLGNNLKRYAITADGNYILLC